MDLEGASAATYRFRFIDDLASQPHPSPRCRRTRKPTVVDRDSAANYSTSGLAVSRNAPAPDD
jgi:hypothetical protein